MVTFIILECENILESIRSLIPCNYVKILQQFGFQSGAHLDSLSFYKNFLARGFQCSPQVWLSLIIFPCSTLLLYYPLPSPRAIGAAPYLYSWPSWRNANILDVLLSLYIVVILLNCFLRWTPPVTIVFQYSVLLLQYYLYTYRSRGVSSIMLFLSERTWGCTALLFHGMYCFRVSAKGRL